MIFLIKLLTPPSTKTLLALKESAHFSFTEGNYQKAMTHYKAAIAKTSSIYGSGSQGYGLFVLRSILKYIKSKSKYDQALTVLYHALKVALSQDDKDPNLYQTIWTGIGSINIIKGNYAEALICYRNVVSICKSTHGKKSPEMADVLHDISSIYSRQKKYTKAIDTLKKALNIKIEHYGEKHVAIAETYNRLGQVHQAQKDHCAAFTCYRRALDIKKKEFGDDHIETAQCNINIGSLCRDCGEHQDALNYYNRALEAFNNLKITDIDTLCPLYINIGLASAAEEGITSGLRWFKKAKALCVSKAGKNHTIVSNVYDSMGTVYQKDDEREKALKYWKKALLIRREGPW